MRRRLVLTFVAVAVVVLAIAWASVLLSHWSDGSVLPQLLLGVTTLACAVATGTIVADRLSRPFCELSAIAEQIGEGRFDVHIPHYAMPEAEALSRSLREAARRLDGLVSHEQAIAVTASHELRTPITALRLSLEDLTLWQHTPADVTAEIEHSIAELDRLSLAVTELLDRTETNREASTVDVAAAILEVVETWRTRVPTGHDITLDAPGPLLARAPLETLRRALELMLAHVTTRSPAGVSVDVVRLGRTVRIRVSHDGPRVLPPGVLHGTTPQASADGDAGLPEAGAAAEAMGGYLAVEDSPTTCLVLLVPSADRAAS